MSMRSDCLVSGRPGLRPLSRPGAQRLILEMTCPLSCCYHTGAGEGAGGAVRGGDVNDGVRRGAVDISPPSLLAQLGGISAL